VLHPRTSLLPASQSACDLPRHVSLAAEEAYPKAPCTFPLGFQVFVPGRTQIAAFLLAGIKSGGAGSLNVRITSALWRWRSRVAGPARDHSRQDVLRRGTERVRDGVRQGPERRSRGSLDGDCKGSVVSKMRGKGVCGGAVVGSRRGLGSQQRSEL